MVEEVKQGGTQKLERLKSIEDVMRQQALDEKVYETQATEGYEDLSFEEAQNGKYLATFPYPYMNGYLHLGKSHFCRVQTVVFRQSCTDSRVSQTF